MRKVYPKTLSEHGATTNQYINYTPYLVARPRSDYWQPENLSVFTGNPIEETSWTRAAYCMGIPRVGKVQSRTQHRLPNHIHNHHPEFSYTPGVYNLTELNSQQPTNLFSTFKSRGKNYGEAALADTGQTPTSTGIRTVTQLFQLSVSA